MSSILPKREASGRQKCGEKKKCGTPVGWEINARSASAPCFYRCLEPDAIALNVTATIVTAWLAGWLVGWLREWQLGRQAASHPAIQPRSQSVSQSVTYSAKAETKCHLSTAWNSTIADVNVVTSLQRFCLNLYIICNLKSLKNESLII
uniref:Uncharacterized protein n=1 Tax=Glossina austeni TaxID=7395 RepID=A0A1A9UUS2_GLOAU